MIKAKIFDGTEERNIVKAAAILKRGGLVAFPTETVYGLGADALNPKAVCRIFAVKKRPTFNPLIVHVATYDQARLLWKKVPEIARVLAKRFWPGPLTLVLAKTPVVPDIVTGGLDTVAVRMPKHPVALELLRCFGGPIAAPSANLFGCTSPTSAEAVWEDLGKKVDMILDGGHSAVGVESTVVKITGGRLKLLRPGGVTVEALRVFSPVIKKMVQRWPTTFESPGLLASHYAPRTPLLLMEEPYPGFLSKIKKWRQACRRKMGKCPNLGALLFSKNPPRNREFSFVEVLSPKRRLDEAAANLFHAIRKLDKMNLDFIIAEPVPGAGIGLAIMDRLERASHGNVCQN